MSRLITIKDDEAYLRNISIPVEFNDNSLQNDIYILERFCMKNSVMAMAAIQLGIPKRIIYLKNTNLDLIEKEDKTEEEKEYNESSVLINPIVIDKIGLTDYWEACASCMNYMGHVKRPYEMLIKYQDVKGDKHMRIFKGFETTVLSHELDHLDGILHMDIADEVLNMPIEQREEFRKIHGYNIVSKTGDYEELVKSKRLTLR